MQILLVTPPLMQMNSPYPATAYLSGYLRRRGYSVAQRDLSLELLLALFSQPGLSKIEQELKRQKATVSESAQFFIEAFADYKATIDTVISFLQGYDLGVAIRIAERKLLPEGPRFLPLQQYPQLLESFGSLGIHDKAKYLCSLYLDDISDVIQTNIDKNFEFSKYGEQLAASQSSFDGLYNELHSPKSLIDQIIEEKVKEYLVREKPIIVGFTIPFPGNFLGALRAAKIVRDFSPTTKIVIGGGFVNTELRDLTDIRIFKFFDYLVFDDGELALEGIIKYTLGEPAEILTNTWHFKSGEIVKSGPRATKSFAEYAEPSFEGLDHEKYFSMVEMPNPMQRFWSDHRWNKVILAHGCYWKKCTFCDTTLDYISRYEPLKPKTIVDMMERVAKETGTSGFHFVDEAAPPNLLKAVAIEIIRRKLVFSWWGNVRFDSYFTSEVCELLADAGCVAVTGGLEVASPRLLKLINKGVTVEQVAHVTRSFRQAGIFVHAYLMYGFPTQTTAETIDSLEVVRQLFTNSCLNSAFWHRFACTAHSPVGKTPEKFGITLVPENLLNSPRFALNSISFIDPTPCDHESLGIGLKRALYNYMHGIGFQENLQHWFDIKIPKASIAKNYIKDVLSR